MTTTFYRINRAPAERPVVERIQIVDLDRGTFLEAQYNPKEIQVERSAEWSETATSKGNQPELTFVSTKARSLTLELLFDTYESGLDVDELHVRHLVDLLDVVNPAADAREDERRPPRLQLVWGPKSERFVCVLASVTTKYTMFLPDGTRVRATCACKFTEARRKPASRAR